MKNKLALIIAVLTLAGCTKATPYASLETSTRFDVNTFKVDELDTITIICDADTNVEYLFVESGYAAELVILYNSDGSIKTCGK